VWVQPEEASEPTKSSVMPADELERLFVDGPIK